MSRDLPILMSAPMVQACLREVERPGTGKTQTRRILKPQPDMSKIGQPCHPESRGSGSWVWMAYDDRPGYSFATADFKVRFAKGDRLYVREHWRTHRDHDGIAPRDLNDGSRVFVVSYAADGDSYEWLGRFRQGMHMPRWASRLTLTVTDVRVERLQAISAEDAKAEGLESIDQFGNGPTYRDYRLSERHICEWYSDPIKSYRSLWDTINGAGAWARNDWVVAVTFKPERRNIDSEVVR